MEDVVVRDEFRTPAGEGDGFEVRLEELEVAGERAADLVGCQEDGSGLERPFRAWIMFDLGPRALPWAGMGCPVGAEELDSAKVCSMEASSRRRSS